MKECLLKPKFIANSKLLHFYTSTIKKSIKLKSNNVYCDIANIEISKSEEYEILSK